jgi:mono/diheme cytochrome c family protein
MTSRIPRLTATAVAAIVVAACHRGATVSSPTPSTAGTGPAAMAKVGALPSGVTQAMVDSGKALFAASSCQKCHGPGGVGATNGPNLTDATWVQIDGSYDAIVKIITTGVPKAAVKGPYPYNMRPMGGANPPFTDLQVKSLAAYVYSISHK